MQLVIKWRCIQFGLSDLGSVGLTPSALMCVGLGWLCAGCGLGRVWAGLIFCSPLHWLFCSPWGLWTRCGPWETPRMDVWLGVRAGLWQLWVTGTLFGPLLKTWKYETAKGRVKTLSAAVLCSSPCHILSHVYKRQSTGSRKVQQKVNQSSQSELLSKSRLDLTHEGQQTGFELMAKEGRVPCPDHSLRDTLTKTHAITVRYQRCTYSFTVYFLNLQVLGWSDSSSRIHTLNRGTTFD